MVKILQISSLEKVFLDDNIEKFEETKKVIALKGEKVSYQLLYVHDGEEYALEADFSLNCDKRLSPKVKKVGNVPVAMPVFKKSNDEFYLRKTPGLYPDILYPLGEDKVDIVEENCHSLFITLDIPQDIEGGIYELEAVFKVNDEEYKKVFEIEVLNACLPQQELVFTQWFHADCISSYYGYEIFSQKHWEMIENFIKKATEYGINMILTPVFTLPLDTEVGGERPTFQLVDVYGDGGYKFGFDRLKRWIEICKRNGVKYFEISHLFSQWGTGCTPKIEAQTPEGKKNIFGWHKKALSEEYKEFLKAFLPELVSFLKAEGVYENTYFHVSDEPDFEKDFEIYKQERAMLDGMVPEEKIMDAISHYEFYEHGLVKRPVVITKSVEKFLENNVKDLWAYYCCGPATDGYSNRFVSMPSYRNRIIGFQLYKYDVKGFLHWGYNFYYKRLSKGGVNPFMSADAGEGFPAGDAFSVYPGENGAIESIRIVIFNEGLQDLRACKLLESHIGRQAVLDLIEKDGEITFNQYPKNDAGLMAIRQRINEKLKSVLK